MNTSEIRAAYLEFFRQHDHTIVASDALVPEHDPTLLFTGAGMNQFKDQFLGKNLTYRRAVTCQKCFRADDIEQVGKTACHHTFFEMLGNFSFGDYFKREAIVWAWDFLLGRLKLDPNKLYVSVYKDDDEAYGVWKDVVGIPAAKIHRLGEHDNFWPADARSKSPAGTLCGPCTEIFVDLGPQPHCPNPAKCDITCDCKRYVEIWNLVLQQYQKGELPGELIPLKMKNIDTGMGLERTAAVIQGVASNFDNDVFKPIVQAVMQTLGVRPAAGSPEIGSVRRIADHARAVSFLICDGVLPANDGRGYVERRLIRRAMRDGMELGSKEPFLYAIVPVVAKVMQDAYPELARRRENIARIIQAEEERFQTTLANGSRLLKELVADMRDKGLATLPGEEAFRLYDTYGLPLELTESILEESGMKTDRAGFEREMERQRAQARSASSMTDEVFDTGPLSKVKDDVFPTDMLGTRRGRIDAFVQKIIAGDSEVESAEAETQVLVALDRTAFLVGDKGFIRSTRGGEFEVLDTYRNKGWVFHRGVVKKGRIGVEDEVLCKVDLRSRKKPRIEAIVRDEEVVDRAEKGDGVIVVLNRTTFYGEAGGQVGDTGAIKSSTGEVDVLDTKRTHGYFLHVGKVIKGWIEKRQTVSCKVDMARGRAIRRAHSATHLLQHALRKVLGEQVEQAGSLVAPDRLRFDFSHFAALTPDETERVEELVNESILRGARVSAKQMRIGEAKAAGAMALFGEKYGEVVRVVNVGNYSMELCGGTHVTKASDIGLFRIVSESSVAAGTRRIEAVTGREAIEHGRRRERVLEQVAAALGSDETRVLDRSARLLDENRELKAEVRKLKKQGTGQSADDIVASAADAAGVRVVAHRTDLKIDDLRELCDVLKRKLGSGVVVLASDADGKVAMIVGVTKDLVPRLNAGKIVKDIASVGGGTGGGLPDMAQAGAKDVSKIDDMLAAAVGVVRKYVG